jgi:hypothetical protein
MRKKIFVWRDGSGSISQSPGLRIKMSRVPNIDPVFVNLLGAQESNPSLAGRYATLFVVLARQAT